MTGDADLEDHRVVKLPTILLALTLASALVGCATTIIPPRYSVDPVPVFVLDHGNTSSLVIPAEDGGMLRYAYGDWDYYALRKHDLWHGMAALLWPTPAALGRAKFDAPLTAEGLHRHIHSIESVETVDVERSRVRAFERSMEGLYQAGFSSRVENHPTGMSFVPHPKRYTYLNNSNRELARWLRALGCNTRGMALHSAWRVASAK